MFKKIQTDRWKTKNYLTYVYIETFFKFICLVSPPKFWQNYRETFCIETEGSTIYITYHQVRLQSIINNLSEFAQHKFILNSDQISITN